MSEKELGMLAVVVLKAKNLHDRHSFYKQDPYAKVTLNGKTFKTEADVKGGQRPEWDAEFRFPVYASKKDSARQLEVACWRVEPREDEEIGKGKVDISETLKTGEFDDWVTINDASGTYRGEIYLEMTFFSSGPPSLERRPSKLPPQERLQHLKKQSGAPTAGGKLAVPGGSHGHGHGHGPGSPQMDKPLPSVHETPGPAPVPSLLRPGTGPGIPNGHADPPDTRTSTVPPVQTKPPLSLTAGRPPGHHRTSSEPLKVPGQRPPSSGGGYSSSHSPPHPGYSPPRPSYSPPRQARPEYNPYVSDPGPPSTSGNTFFPSPQIVVGPSPSDPTAYNPPATGSTYNPPRHTSPRHSPPHPPSPPVPGSYPGAPNFPSAPPQQPPPNFHPPQQSSPNFHPPQPTSSSYPPPQSNYPPSQLGYSQPQSPYPPQSQSTYPIQGQPQFPYHPPQFNPHQGPHTTYGYGPSSGPGPRPSFGRGDSVGELPDPALAQRYSSPLPLPNDTKPRRSHSPFPTPIIPPPLHPVPEAYSPGGEFDREFQRRREQEERDAEFARKLDLEFNLGTH